MLEAKDATKRTLENLIGPELMLLVETAITQATAELGFTTNVLLHEKTEAAIPLLVELLHLCGYKVIASETKPTFLVISWYPK